MRRVAAAALFLFAFANCGGGGPGGSPSDKGPIVPVGELRADLKFGYWAGELAYMPEECNHVNLWWARDDTAPAWHLAIAAQLQAARGCGIKNVALQLNTTDIADLRFQFARLSEGGYFNGWDSFTLYPMDEPGSAQGGRRSDAEVTEILARLRQLAFDTPGLLGAKMGVFYGCDDPKPGIKAYDFVGCFRYGSNGCQRLEADYAALRSQLAPRARLWMIPGGATIGGNEGRQDPACWASYAHRHPDVWGVIGFLWQSVAGVPPLLGIRENGMAKLYCETGKTILDPKTLPAC